MPPDPLLMKFSSLLQDKNLEGPILDLACGSGENGLFLAALNLPVIEVPGAYPSAGTRLWTMTKRLMFNAFPFAVVALFFWLQMLINRQTHDVAYQFALGATVLVEIGLIFMWSLFLD